MSNAANDLKQVRFRINNGKVMRRINLLRYDFVDLQSVQRVVEQDGIRSNEFLDCVNYLSEAGYIELRRIGSHKAARLADSDYMTLEAKVSANGIRLLAGGLNDELVEV